MSPLCASLLIDLNHISAFPDSAGYPPQGGDCRFCIPFVLDDYGPQHVHRSRFAKPRTRQVARRVQRTTHLVRLCAARPCPLRRVRWRLHAPGRGRPCAASPACQLAPARPPAAPRGGSLRCGARGSVSRRSLRSLCPVVSGPRPEECPISPPFGPVPPAGGDFLGAGPAAGQRSGCAVRGEGAASRRPPAQRAAALRGDAAGEPVRPAPASASPSPARRASDTRADAAGEA